MEDNLFYNHLLQKRHNVPIANPAEDLVWPSIFLIVCLCLLALVKVSAFSKINKIIQSIFSRQVLNRLEREETGYFKFYHLALNLFFVFNVSFLIYKINTIYQLVLVQQADFVQFCFFVATTLLLYTYRYLMNNLLSFFTNERKLILEYVSNCAYINQGFGLFLFPCIVIAEFSQFNPIIFTSIALAVLVSSLIFRWYRGIIIGLLQERIGLLQTFSYFCALEILPTLVLVKYIIETF